MDPVTAIAPGPRATALPSCVGELAKPGEAVSGQLSAYDVEQAFEREPHRTSLVIAAGDGRIEVLTRRRFDAQMSGRLGYGRSLYHRLPVARLPGAPPSLVLASATALSDAGAAALAREPEHRYDDLVVVFPDAAVGTVTVADLFAELSRAHGHRALHDHLTGLANRALFGDRLRHAHARSARTGAEVSVLFIDLDDFKSVNDSLGHEAGDELLIAVAQRLDAAVRGKDTVARLGGDEFGVLCEETGAQAAAATATRLLNRLAEPVAVAGRRMVVRASVGVSTSPGIDLAEELVRNADLAMYRAKHSGKSSVAIYEPGMHASAVAKLELKSDLDAALDRNELALVYQPIVALGSERIVAVEALLRWQHPIRGSIPPAEFVPLAEQTGAIMPIGSWVLGEACRQVRRWDHARVGQPPLAVSVNVAPSQLDDPQFVASVAAALADAELPAGRLTLELTEGVLVREDTTATLGALKRLGVRIAIDDFGTGFSSLSYLRRFPIDVIKIDRSFTGGIREGTAGRDVIAGILKLADSLGVTTLAEGIEIGEELHALRDMCCSLGQGFLFDKPLSCDDLSRKLSAPSVAASGGRGEAVAGEPA